jgi:hypothetical protein
MSSVNKYEDFLGENSSKSFLDFRNSLPYYSVYTSERCWDDFYDFYSNLKINKIYNPLTLKGNESFRIVLYKSLKGDIYVFSILIKKGIEKLSGYTTPENFFPARFFCNNVEISNI